MHSKRKCNYEQYSGNCSPSKVHSVIVNRVENHIDKNSCCHTEQYKNKKHMRDATRVKLHSNADSI